METLNARSSYGQHKALWNRALDRSSVSFGCLASVSRLCNRLAKSWIFFSDGHRTAHTDAELSSTKSDMSNIKALLFAKFATIIENLINLMSWYQKFNLLININDLTISLWEIYIVNIQRKTHFTSLLKLLYDYYFWKKSLSFVGLPRRPRSVRNHDRSCTADIHVTPPTSFLTCQLLLRNSHDFWVLYIQPKADSRRSYDFSCGLPGWTCQSTINSAWRPYGCFTIVKKAFCFLFQ